MASESLIYRIKAIWQGGRATAEASQDIQGVGKAGKNTESSLRSLMGKAAVAGAAIAGAAYTAKQGWEALGEGADQLRVEEKFAAAAQHIGTTAGQLKDAVMDATGGMISEAEATAGALELIDTGLASNQDEVVRLSRLIGELGWDMQALTLTMLNDSEKRLDTLGLSAERVAELEQKYLDLGMAHEQAFDIAVMEAGEEKLAIYGSMAESTAGQMARIEAHWANVVDHMKQGAALAAGPLIEGMSNQIDMHDRLDALLEKRIINEREYKDLRMQMSRLGTDFIDDQVTAFENSRKAIALQNEELRENEIRARNAAAGNRELAEAAVVVSEAVQAEADAADQATMAYADNWKWLQATNKLRERSNETYEDAVAVGKEWMESNAALEKQMGGPFLQALETADDETVNFNQVMLEAAAQSGASAEALGILAAATGEYSDSQIEAAINTAAMTAKAQQLGEAVAAGDLSARGAIEAFREFQAQLNEPYHAEITDNTDEAIERAHELDRALDAASGDRYARFYIQTIGGPPQTDPNRIGGVARASGGPVRSNQPYLVGEEGPEWFVPNTNGTVLPNGQSPGGDIYNSYQISLVVDGRQSQLPAGEGEAAPLLNAARSMGMPI